MAIISADPELHGPSFGARSRAAERARDRGGRLSLDLYRGFVLAALLVLAASLTATLCLFGISLMR
jgi:hypothetical protein